MTFKVSDMFSEGDMIFDSFWCIMINSRHRSNYYFCGIGHSGSGPRLLWDNICIHVYSHLHYIYIMTVSINNNSIIYTDLLDQQ